MKHITHTPKDQVSMPFSRGRKWRLRSTSTFFPLTSRSKAYSSNRTKPRKKRN